MGKLQDAIGKFDFFSKLASLYYFLIQQPQYYIQMHRLYLLQMGKRD